MSHDRAAARHRMVDEQLAARGIEDQRVLAAMRRVPRHEFVPDDLADLAYDDRPLPIGHDVTISQPYIVALMSQVLAVQPTDRVLEIGTGSGYGAAVLAELGAHVTTVECIEHHAQRARDRLARYRDRVDVVAGDGTLGHPAGAPYDAISVTAAGPVIPQPLRDQLGPNGRLVMPVGSGVEDLVRLTRTTDGDVTDTIIQVRFVPLTGRHGA